MNSESQDPFISDDVDMADLAAIDAFLKKESPDIFKEFEKLKKEKFENVFDSEVTSSPSPWFFLTNLRWEIGSFIRTALSRFQKLSSLDQLRLGSLFIFLISTPFGIWILLTDFFNFAPRGTLTDLSSFSDYTFPIKKETLREDFFRSTRSPPNIFLIKRFVVNLAKSEKQGSPMLMAELYLEALNPHSLVQVKNQEAYFRDLIISFTSQWSYQDLSSQEGKQSYLKELRDELQKKIKKGQLSRIYFKNIILKPF
jgi:flagellar basal body-associated protein FliL